jgi:allantoinase
VSKEPYEYSPLPERARLEWPDGARVAFYLAVNVEHYPFGRPSTSIAQFTQGFVPDPLNHGWRDYGPRVGIWRLMELVDRLAIPVSAMLNSEAAARYPQIVQAGLERHWAFVAHGRNNAALHTELAEDDERAQLTAMVAEIEAATGRRPRGWLGPALTETFATPRLLAELGFTYTLDWCNDDQPYPLDVEGMISVPYTVELNDVPLFVERGIGGDDYVRLVSDQLEQLLEDGRTSGRVMALVVHPFVMGQPWRHRHLARALELIAAADGVWLTTSDAIAAHYLGR